MTGSFANPDFSRRRETCGLVVARTGIFPNKPQVFQAVVDARGNAGVIRSTFRSHSVNYCG